MSKMVLAKIFSLLALVAAFVLLGTTTTINAAPQAVLVVKSAIDWLPGACDSDCTLREAVLAANATVGTRETIKFHIPTTSTNCDTNSGVCTIKLLGALPDITDPVVLDGYTQSGAHSNTLADGDDADLRIVVDGTAVNTSGLVLKGGNSVVRGLILANFSSNQGPAALSLESDNNAVQGNFIGTDISGTLAQSNTFGVWVTGARNEVGGTTPAARNLISGNGTGVYISGAHNQVQGNYIGTIRDGRDALGNTYFGVALDGAAHNTIGGKTVVARNIISGNAEGIRIGGTSVGNKILGNGIGVDWNRGGLPNTHQGIHLFGAPVASQYVRNNLIANNEIAHNGTHGIELGGTADDLSYGNTYTQNAIYANGLKGILNNFTADGLADVGDDDEGPNHLQNAPALFSAKSTKSKTTVRGNLASAPNTSYRLEFFINELCDPNGYGEGNAFFGSLIVTTDADGIAVYTFTTPKHFKQPFLITATATEKVGKKFRSTSQFSNCVPLK